MNKAFIIDALALLDPARDEHWTTDGLPRVDVLSELLGGEKVTRQLVTEAAPEFTRGVALKVGTGLAMTDEGATNEAASVIPATAPEAAPTEDEALKATIRSQIIQTMVSMDAPPSFEELQGEYGSNLDDAELLRLCIAASTEAMEIWKGRADLAQGRIVANSKATKTFQVKLVQASEGELTGFALDNQRYLESQQKLRDERGAAGVGQVAPVDYVGPRARPVLRPR